MQHPISRKSYLRVLSVFYFLFLFRVLAQLIQKFAPVTFLPEFNAWHSETISYSALLSSQIVIIVLMSYVLIKFIQGKLLPSRKLGKLLLVLGAIYFISMLFRLIAGLTIFIDKPWFTAYIPTIFHLDLALFLLTLAKFHFTERKHDIS